RIQEEFKLQDAENIIYSKYELLLEKINLLIKSILTFKSLQAANIYSLLKQLRIIRNLVTTQQLIVIDASQSFQRYNEIEKASNVNLVYEDIVFFVNRIKNN